MQCRVYRLGLCVVVCGEVRSARVEGRETEAGERGGGRSFLGSATSGRAVSRSAAGQRPAPRRPRRHDFGGRAQGLAGGQRSPGQEASSRSRASLRIPLSSLRLGGQAGAAASGLGTRGLTQDAAGQETGAQWLGVPEWRLQAGHALDVAAFRSIT